MCRLRLLPIAAVLFAALVAAPAPAADADPVWNGVEHHWTVNDGVKIHYVTYGPTAGAARDTVLFVHGFPDFWYSWRHQMAALGPRFRTAALDLRGYNQSDQPEGVEQYRMPLLLADIGAVVKDLGGKVTLVGHDWGGALAWRFAMEHPESVERLVICNLTHPRGYSAVVANPTEAQKANTEYARRFASSQPDGSPVPERMLAMGERFGPEVGARYREAFSRSSYDGMLNYYRANYGVATSGTDQLPNLAMPVLQFHGLKDTAVDKDGLRGTWDWIDADYTLVTIPSSGHWVQSEAAELVSSTLEAWLEQRTQ